jgi:hypothetical protein
MLTRYHHYSPIHNIVGFVVNMHDPVNFDIDLHLDEHTRTRYWNVIVNEYTFTEEDRPVRSRIAYRCRLKGIGIVSPPQRTTGQSESGSRTRPYDDAASKWLLRKAHKALREQIDLQNGWVLCSISDVDVYRRMLVTLYDPVSKMELSSILLSERFRRCFRPYDCGPSAYSGTGTRRERAVVPRDGRVEERIELERERDLEEKEDASEAFFAGQGSEERATITLARSSS